MDYAKFDTRLRRRITEGDKLSNLSDNGEERGRSTIVEITATKIRYVRGGKPLPGKKKSAKTISIVLMHNVYCKFAGKRISTAEIDNPKLFGEGEKWGAEWIAIVGRNGTPCHKAFFFQVLLKMGIVPSVEKISHDVFEATIPTVAGKGEDYEF